MKGFDDYTVDRIWNGLATVRSTNVEDAYDTGKGLILKLKGTNQKMTLQHAQLAPELRWGTNKKEWRSKFKPYRKYKLLDYKWIPDEE
jgi:hypothetical protein|tara:strand:+ start:232 stop:495 length:264 start_codon:yes stop_codon:yes gene_type:complete